MRTLFSFISLLFFFHLLHHPCQSQNIIAPNTTGYQCSTNQTNSTTTYPCHSYAYYTASSPNFLDLASIGDLFSVSRQMIATASNLSAANATLAPSQPLLIPLLCSCNPINSSFPSLSFANLSHIIRQGDTFYQLSSFSYNNLTTYQSVEVVNPTLIPTNLTIGVTAIFPVFCACPNDSRDTMISYVVQPGDTAASIAARLGSSEAAVVAANRKGFREFDTVFVPVRRLPVIAQIVPAVNSTPPAAPAGSPVAVGPGSGDRRGLRIAVGVLGGLLVLVLGVWVYRERVMRKKVVGNDEKKRGEGFVKKGMREEEVNVKLMANVSDCLDKYRVFGYEELSEATDGFDERCLILGSVYRGTIDGQVFAIKKMKWNAYEELKILQKVTTLLFTF